MAVTRRRFLRAAALWTGLFPAALDHMISRLDAQQDSDRAEKRPLPPLHDDRPLPPPPMEPPRQRPRQALRIEMLVRGEAGNSSFEVNAACF